MMEWNRARVVAVMLVLGAVFVGVGSLGVAGANGTNNSSNATLNDTAPYYANESAAVNSSAWFAGKSEVSLPNVTGMLTRLGPYIIGTGSTMQGGVGYSGPIVLGLLVAGVFVGATAGVNLGWEGGSVVSLVVAYGLIDVGLAPPWLKIVVLMLLGSVTAVVALRAR